MEEARESQLFTRIAELGKEFEAVSLRCCSTIPSLAVGCVTTSSSERTRSDRDGIQNGGVGIDLDTEIEAARQNLAELDRLRELAAARLTELERLGG